MPTWTQYRDWLKNEAPTFQVPAVAPPGPEKFSTDSRAIARGEWFVPLSGESFDGHAFIVEAMAKGAAGFFYAQTRAPDLPAALLSKGIAVNGPLSALQAIASGWRGTLRRTTTILALTGSSGKTTTKEMLCAVLRAAGPTFATEGSFNNEIGVPKTLLRLTRAHKYAALEFGARNPNDIRFLCEMARPDIGCVLNVGTAHLGVFGSPERLLKAKLELFAFATHDMKQVAFHDDARILKGARNTGRDTITFGYDPNADVVITETVWSKTDGSMTVALRLRNEPVTIRLGVAHEAFAANVAATVAMATAAEIDLGTIARGLEGFVGIKGRFQIHRRGPTTIVDDSYNANPESMRAGLSTLSKSFPDARKVLVLGDMLELGATSAAEHRELGAFAAKTVCPERLITVGRDARHFADGAVAEGLAANRIESFTSVEELLSQAADLTAQGDVIFAKASHGIRLDKLIDKLLA